MAQQYIGITLPITNGNTGMFAQSTSLLQQVKSNFKNLILTRKGERIMQPEFGCDLHTLLFENITGDTLESAKFAVTNATEQWMPFLEIISVDAINTPSNPNTIDMTVVYRFRNNPNVTDTITVSV
jgi:phage baseplate assembly protein W